MVRGKLAWMRCTMLLLLCMCSRVQTAQILPPNAATGMPCAINAK